MRFNFVYIIRLWVLERPMRHLVMRIRKAARNPREKEKRCENTEGASTLPSVFKVIHVDTGRRRQFVESIPIDRLGSPPNRIE